METLTRLRERKCDWCGAKFLGHHNARYCCDEHKAKAVSKRQKEYQKNRTDQQYALRKNRAMLTDEQKAEKFKLGISIVKGTVMHRNKERRAVLFRTPAGVNDPVYMENEITGLIEVLCTNKTKTTFKPIEKAK